VLVELSAASEWDLIVVDGADPEPIAFTRSEAERIVGTTPVSIPAGSSFRLGLPLQPPPDGLVEALRVACDHEQEIALRRHRRASVRHSQRVLARHAEGEGRPAAESSGVAGRTLEKRSSTRRAAKPKARARRRLRLLWLTGIVAISAYLYYQPLASYFDARNDLASARAEVELLQLGNERLEQRLAVSTSIEATRREARRIGYVRPGEQLFIVKGIPDWRRSLRSLRSGG
jgi:hypothetical protein